MNKSGVAQARRLIKAKQYVLNSNWGDVQPKAASENAFLKEHTWQRYSGWFPGLTDGASDETKGLSSPLCQARGELLVQVLDGRLMETLVAHDVSLPQTRLLSPSSLGSFELAMLSSVPSGLPVRAP